MRVCACVCMCVCCACAPAERGAGEADEEDEIIVSGSSGNPGTGSSQPLLCPHDPHRLQVHLWGQKAKEGRAGNPRAGSLEHSGKTSGATVGLRQKCLHPTHLCASDQTLPSPQG